MRTNVTTLPSSIDTLVVGGGQAGLAMSAFLGRARQEHLVVERRDRLGGGWQDRWDGFTLVTPNWLSALPEYPYEGDDPDGFMGRDAIAARVAGYADAVDAPVALGTQVHRLAPGPDGLVAETSGGTVRANRVVVATGSYHVPRIPPIAARISDRVLQLHAHEYRNPAALPPGGVLVVGSGQTGVQVAEEVEDAGRPVYLAVGKAGRAPRRYRGQDLFRWLFLLATRGAEVGISLPTVDELPDPRLKFAANPHLSGTKGGHEINLRQLGARGIHLAGRLANADGERLSFAPDLAERLAQADQFFDRDLRGRIDAFIERTGIEAPPDDRAVVAAEPEGLTDLDLAAAGVSTIIWATGYALNYGWIDAPIFDELGYPRQDRGVTEVPGLYFVGLSWQSSLASATLAGPWIDGQAIARELTMAAV